MREYLVYAFNKEPFRGKPAAVCVMDFWPSDEFMMNRAEQKFFETAFLVKEAEGYHLRWFTPKTELEICEHAALAAAFVVLKYYDTDAEEVTFHTLSGDLVVRKRGEMPELDFPRYKLTEIPVTDAMEQAFGIRPVKAVLGLDLICVFESEEQVRSMTPKQELLKGLEGRIQNATAKGTETDCVSRSFCPKIDIPEDRVCSSAHVQLADFWAQELGKEEIYAYQASERGGYLRCRMLGGDRIAIRGDAIVMRISELRGAPS